MTIEPPSVEQDNKPAGQGAILNLYAAFGVSMILGVLPYVSAVALSLVFFFGVLIAAYVVRGISEPESLSDNHATYIIKTIWIASLFLLVTSIGAFVYIYGNLDTEPLNLCIQKLLDGDQMFVKSPSPMELYKVIEPCVPDYLLVNKSLIINSLIISLCPIMLYLFYRLGKGLSRAIKGYRLANPKVWF